MIYHTYIALLRGINVSGQKIIKIDELRKLFEDSGFKNVKTYIQSGNVIFNSHINSAEKIVKLVEKKIKEVFSFEVTVLIRTHNELGRIIQKNPFLKTKPLEKLYVAFLSDIADKDDSDKLLKYKSKTEEFRITNKVVYLYYSDGAGRTKLTNNIIESKLGVKATTRNWNTVNKLFEMSKELYKYV
jgi:uncharacterized protein (DUF1697 family)